MGTWEQEPLVPVSSSSPVTPRDSAFVSSMNGRSPHLWDLHILSSAFFFVYLAFCSLQNLESSIHGDGGLGPTSVGVLYLSSTFASLAAPLFVVWLGSKRALLVGFSGYWVFTSANLYPSWVSMIPASLFLGFTASILWCAQGTYLTYAAKCHAISCGVSEESAIGSFNGEFWGFNASTQFVGNLLSLALLYYWRGSASGPTHLMIAFLASMGVGTAFAASLRPQDRNYMMISEVDLPFSQAKSREPVKRMLALFHERNMVLLILFLVYSGFQQAFIWGDFTKDIVSPAFGVTWVGGAMALYGASDAFSSFVAGRFSTGLPAIAAITCVGATAQGMALVMLVFKQQYGGGWFDCLLLSGLAVAWGVGDAAYNTQISALLGILYPDNTEAAFAQWRIWQSAGTSVAFFASPRIDFFIKLYVLLALLALSVATFLFVIMRHMRGNRRQ